MVGSTLDVVRIIVAAITLVGLCLACSLVWRDRLLRGLFFGWALAMGSTLALDILETFLLMGSDIVFDLRSLMFRAIIGVTTWWFLVRLAQQSKWRGGEGTDG
jgi:hypothetical protein